MGLFSRKSPEEKKLKELTGGFSLSSDFIALLEENNLIGVFPKAKLTVGTNIQSLLKIKIINKEITIDEIEPELNLMIKKAKYIKENFSIIKYCPNCGNELSKYNIFICEVCEHDMFDEYKFTKLNNKELQHRKKIMDIVNNNDKIDLINKSLKQLKHYECIIKSERFENGILHETKLLFDYPKHYTEVSGNNDLLCRLSRNFNNIKINIDISVEDSPKKSNPAAFNENKYILSTNEKYIYLNSWNLKGEKFNGEQRFFKGETETEKIFKFYHFTFSTSNKIITFACNIPLELYSNDINTILLYDLKVISNNIKTEEIYDEIQF